MMPARFRCTLIASLAMTSVLAWSCASTPSSTDPLIRRASGKALHERRCGTCHALYPPASRSGNEWRRVIDEMASEAKLSNDEEQRVLEYLLASSAAKRN